METVHFCPNCHREAPEAYCSFCGQRQQIPRYTLRRIASDLAAVVTNLEKGFLHTAGSLLRSPGQVLSDVLGGKTVPYTPPFQFLLLTVGISILVYVYSGAYDQSSRLPESLGLPSNSATSESQQAYYNTMKEYLNVVFLAAVPFVSLSSWLVFRRKGYNFAEHLVLNAYLYGELALVSSPLVPLLAYSPAYFGIGTLVSYTFTVGYMAFAFRGIFGLSWTGALWRSLVIFIMGYTLFSLSAGVAGILFFLVRHLAR